MTIPAAIPIIEDHRLCEKVLSRCQTDDDVFFHAAGDALANGIARPFQARQGLSLAARIAVVSRWSNIELRGSERMANRQKCQPGKESL